MNRIKEDIEPETVRNYAIKAKETNNQKENHATWWKVARNSMSLHKSLQSKVWAYQLPVCKQASRWTFSCIRLSVWLSDCPTLTPSTVDTVELCKQIPCRIRARRGSGGLCTKRLMITRITSGIYWQGIECADAANEVERVWWTMIIHTWSSITIYRGPTPMLVMAIASSGDRSEPSPMVNTCRFHCRQWRRRKVLYSKGSVAAASVLVLFSWRTSCM